MHLPAHEALRVELSEHGGDAPTLQILTNQVWVLWSRDQYWPIRGQYSGHMTSIDQWQPSIHLNSSAAVGAYPRAEQGGSASLAIRLSLLLPEDNNQSEISIQFTCLILTNERPVFESRDLYWPIRGQYSPEGCWTELHAAAGAAEQIQAPGAAHGGDGLKINKSEASI